MSDLTPEQYAGAEFLAARRVALLADKAGFGKTAQYVRACDYVQAERITLICPRVLRVKEVAEFERWSMFGYAATVIRSVADDIPRGPGLVVVNYDLARQPSVKRRLLERGCDVLICDEAHRAKAPGGKTTTALFGRGGLQKTAKRVWLATGTPTPNGAHEYYVFAKLAGAWVGTYDAFQRRYCRVIDGQYGPKIVGINHDALPELKEALRPFVLQRYSADTSRPPLRLDSVNVDGELPSLEGIDEAALAAILRALEAGNWELLEHPFIATMRRRIGLAKAGGVAKLAAQELRAGVPKMLIFAEHTDVIDSLARELEPFGVGIVDGRTSEKTAERVIRAFVPGVTDGPRVAVIQRMSLKEGRDMLLGRRILLAERAWTPDDNEQMIARADRRGQTEQVHASVCRLPGSLDDAQDRVLARKAKDIASLRIQPLV